MSKTICIVGPTASGKTAISIEIAKCFNGEIISGDSIQVYRELNIGSAKITKEEIKEYLNRVDKLLDKLKGEDKETLSWLIYGYNQCAKLLNEIQKENEKLKAEYGTKVQVERDFLNEENEKYKEVIDRKNIY